MKRTKLALILGIVASIFAANNFAALAFTYTTPKDASRSELSASISSELEEKITASPGTSKYSVIIEMAEEADLQPAQENFSDDPVAQRKAVIGELSETAVKSQRQLIDLLESYEQQGRAKDIETFYIVNAIAAYVDADGIKEIARRSDVKLVHLNKKIRSVQPIRTLTRSARALGEGIEWGVQSIGAPRVWDELNIDGTGVTVGVIDSGVNYKHSAITQKFKAYDKDYGIFGADKSYQDFVSDDRDLSDTSHNHGTHVTGTILGSDGDANRIGVAPGAKYVAARAIGATSGDESSMIRAAQWIMKPAGRAENAPRVVNNSWGGDSEESDWFAQIIEKWRAAGIFPVFAAGNTSDYPADGSLANPGNLPGVFSVAACDRQGKLADFSRVGPSPFQKDLIKPDICAPGVRIRSSLASGGYASWSGTSMAAPHVTGTVALMLQANPDLKVDEIEQILRSTAVSATDLRYPESPNMGYGYGNLNAYDAVRKAQALRKGNTEKTDIAITGHVLQKGEDRRSPIITPTWPELAFIGQSIDVQAKIKDDVSIVSAKAFYRNGESGEFVELPMRQTSGDTREGDYAGKIPASDIRGAKIQVKIVAHDYAGNQVGGTDIHEIAIKPGIRPDEYANDFEHNIDGWKFSGSSASGSVAGDWNWGTPVQKNEPTPNGKKLLGTKVGHVAPTRQIDSYALMPPIDLSGMSGKNVALSFDEYLGFNGVSTAKIQVADSEQGKWEDLDQKLIPPGSAPAWQKVYYNLGKWAGSNNPIFVRFAFRYPDHGSGPGWYIDNVRLDTSDKTAPDPVHNLQGTQRGIGVEVRWEKAQANDVIEYAVYRGDSSKNLHKIATVPSDSAKLVYLDSKIEPGKEAVYAVRAVDSFGNESKIVQKLSLTRANISNIVNYSGSEDDHFTSGVIEGTANDWEAGVVHPVANDDSPLALREAQLGLKEKISAGDSVWGTNLGRQISDSELYDARLSGRQHSYVQTPFFTPEKNSVLEFESYNAQHYLGEYQDNLSSVQIVKKDGVATGIIDAQTIMHNSEKFLFRWINAEIGRYAGQEIAIRFVQKTGANVINDYELGWYIDNIRVGEASKDIAPENADEQEIISSQKKLHTQKFYTQVAPELPATFEENAESEIQSTGNETEGNGAENAAGDSRASDSTIPILGAEVEILELGRRVPVNGKDGSFSANVSSGTWTIQARAYGFVSQRKEIDSAQNVDFVLEKAPQSALSGKVVDESGHPISGAHVRIVEDANIAPVQVEKDGTYHLQGVYRHEQVTLRAFAPGYHNSDLLISSDDSENGHDVVLRKLEGTSAELAYDNGSARTNVVHTKAQRGVAVRFYPAKTPASVTGIKMFVADADKASKKDLQVLVLAQDKNQRLQTLAQLDSVSMHTGWNTVDLSGYAVKVSGAFYVVAVQNHPGPDSVGVAVDTQGTNVDATKRTYLYDGDFTPALDANVVGAAMLRADLHYDANAQNSPNELPENEQSAPDAPENAQEDFEWEIADDHAVVKKYVGQSKNVNVPSRWINPETKKVLPVRGVASNAFAWKYRESITLPEGITDLAPNAFTWALKTGGVLHIPSTVKELKANALSQVGAERITGLSGVTEIVQDVFKDTHGVTIDMPNVRTIDPNAFRSTRDGNFEYNKIITAPGNPEGLTAADGQYLINPAVLIVKVEIAGAEKIDQTIRYIGPGNSGTAYPISKKAHEFYQVGQKVKVDAPRNALVSYIDETKEVTLRSATTAVTFFALNLKGEIRTPLISADKEIFGVTVPQARISVEICGDGIVDNNCTKLSEVKADAIGEFKVPLDKPLELGQKVKVTITDKRGKEYEHSPLKVGEAPSSRLFLMDSSPNGVLQRYLGEGGEIDFPASALDMNGTERPVNIVGSYALAAKNLTRVNNLGSVGTVKEIKEGAFARNSLQEIDLPVNVRQIGARAFADNQLKTLTLPNLMHRVGDAAFAHNHLSSLTPGKYTNHYGNYAFAHNELKSVRFGANLEDLGKAAFAHNKLTSVDFESEHKLNPQDRHISASAHGMSEILAETFAHNDLQEVHLPARISSVDPSAFAENGRFVNLISDNGQISDSILGNSSGHIVNGAAVTVRFLDEKGTQIQPDQVWVGQNMRERTGDNVQAFYRIGQSSEVTAPVISGYTCVDKSVPFTPAKANGTIVELRYRFVASSAGEGGDSDDGSTSQTGDKPDTGSGSGNTSGTGSGTGSGNTSSSETGNHPSASAESAYGKGSSSESPTAQSTQPGKHNHASATQLQKTGQSAGGWIAISAAIGLSGVALLRLRRKVLCESKI